MCLKYICTSPTLCNQNSTSTVERSPAIPVPPLTPINFAKDVPDEFQSRAIDFKKSEESITKLSLEALLRFFLRKLR